MTPGQTLPNGAEILACYYGGDFHDNVLLCKWKRGDRIEWVTWRINLGQSEPYWGRYFFDEYLARNDFDRRVLEWVE